MNKSGFEDWEIAYLARRLRREKIVTLSCSEGDTCTLLEKLGQFSYSTPLMSKMVGKPNSNEVLLEIVN